MPFSRILLISSILLLSACGQNESVTLSTRLNEQDVAWARAKGNNSISGRAFAITDTGSTMTCEKMKITAIPDSAYARERMEYIYGSTTQGYREITVGKNDIIDFHPDLPLYKETYISTCCGKDGKFAFNNLPDGKWYVVIKITWRTFPGPDEYHGYFLMKSVDLTGDTRANVTLSK